MQQVGFGYQVNLYNFRSENSFQLTLFVCLFFKLANAVDENVLANCTHSDIPAASAMVSK